MFHMQPTQPAKGRAVTKPISEFKGKAGRIYVEKADDVDERHYEVSFEDLCILGTGNSELEALEDAVRHVADISTLVSEAIVSVSIAAHEAGVGG